MQIDRRGFLKVASAGVCFATMSSMSALGKQSSRKPNIILCMADDQGWGDMAYNGHPVLKTPNFDAMADAALRFDRFYAAAPVCSPTRGSVMTGRHPNRFGCFKWGHTLRPQEVTIPEALKKAGYVTGHFGKWHLGSVRKGCPVNPGASGFDEWLSAPNFFDNGSPHGPHEAIERDRAIYKTQSKKLQHFYGEITGMDRAFGKLRGELRTLGIHENTILWYCSDNGVLPGVGTTGGRGNKGKVYEGGLRVPAILEWPARIANPRKTDVPCNTSDIYPTLLEIAGVRIKKQPKLDGISLVPVIGGKMKSRPKPIGFWDYPIGGIRTPSREFMSELMAAQKKGNEVGDKSRLRMDAGKITKQYPEDTFPGHSAWLDWPWKLHRIENKKGVKFELYNLAEDPKEGNNAAGRHPERLKSMKKELKKWQKSVVRSLNGEDYR